MFPWAAEEDGDTILPRNKFPEIHLLGHLVPKLLPRGCLLIFSSLYGTHLFFQTPGPATSPPCTQMFAQQNQDRQNTVLTRPSFHQREVPDALVSGSAFILLPERRQWWPYISSTPVIPNGSLNLCHQIIESTKIVLNVFFFFSKRTTSLFFW